MVLRRRRGGRRKRWKTKDRTLCCRCCCWWRLCCSCCCCRCPAASDVAETRTEERKRFPRNETKPTQRTVVVIRWVLFCSPPSLTTTTSNLFATHFVRKHFILSRQETLVHSSPLPYACVYACVRVWCMHTLPIYNFCSSQTNQPLNMAVKVPANDSRRFSRMGARTRSWSRNSNAVIVPRL